MSFPQNVAVARIAANLLQHFIGQLFVHTAKLVGLRGRFPDILSEHVRTECQANLSFQRCLASPGNSFLPQRNKLFNIMKSICLL